MCVCVCVCVCVYVCVCVCVSTTHLKSSKSLNMHHIIMQISKNISTQNQGSTTNTKNIKLIHKLNKRF